MLDGLSPKLFSAFIRILNFTALVGEQDRHEENWGVIKNNNVYQISPLYDNGCNLLREFKDEDFANNYYNHKTRYNHFELIRFLNEKYYDDVHIEIMNLNKLTDKKIADIVFGIPDSLFSRIHREFIIKYLIERRNILLNIQ